MNYFDTAEIYGNGTCERLLGRCLKELKWERKDYVISTKIWKIGEGVNDSMLSRKHIIEGLKGSLQRLELEYVDMVLAHRYDEETDMEEVCRAFNYCINWGMALYWGTSQWTPYNIMEAMECCEKFGLIKPVLEQPEYNMLVRRNLEVDLVPFFQSKYRLGTTVWSPLASGLLTGKYNMGEEPEGSRMKEKSWMKGYFYKTYFEDSENKGKTYEKLKKLGELAKDLGVEQVHLALAWVLANKDVSAALMGASKPEQLENNYCKTLELLARWTPEIELKVEEILGNTPENVMNWREFRPFPGRRQAVLAYAQDIPKK